MGSADEGKPRVALPVLKIHPGLSSSRQPLAHSALQSRRANTMIHQRSVNNRKGYRVRADDGRQAPMRDSCSNGRHRLSSAFAMPLSCGVSRRPLRSAFVITYYHSAARLEMARKPVEINGKQRSMQMAK
ncbi:putative peptidase family M1 [Anopheles sinensis]|uniref:Putative peptidase family M1 n=1 Tax=Anopheles sinensis TaxID=74873 RepID=A0A084VAE1_ANOSI|nr:putative peptidase family M1 [Anopheles sinensis]